MRLMRSWLRALLLLSGLSLCLGLVAGEGVAWGAGVVGQGETRAVAQLQPTLTIPAKVTVKGPELRVLELAQAVGVSTELMTQLESVRLGPSPNPGEQQVLPGSTLLARIRSSMPDSASIRWVVPEKVVIIRAATRITAIEVQAALEDWVRAHQAAPIEQLKLEGLQVRSPLVVPVGSLTLDFEPGAGDDLLGPSNLTLLVRIDGEIVEQVPVRVRIDGILRVLVTGRPLRLGQEIGDGDVQEEARQAAQLTGQPALSRSEVVGKVTRRAISANQVLGLEDVADKPIIRKGDSVTLVVRSGAILVTCPGEALADGRPGETISVLNLSTKRQLRGKVKATGEVQIEYRPISDFR